METKELQEKVEEMDRRVMDNLGEPPFDISIVRCLKAQEELGEVAETLIKTKVGPKKKAENKDWLGEELADTITLLIGIANSHDIELKKIMKEKHEENKKKWEKKG